jgi:hypothetical protein
MRYQSLPKDMYFHMEFIRHPNLGDTSVSNTVKRRV